MFSVESCCRSRVLLSDMDAPSVSVLLRSRRRSPLVILPAAVVVPANRRKGSTRTTLLESELVA